MAGKAGAVRAGGAYVELFTEKGPMIRGLRAAEKDFFAWGQRLTKAGSVLTGAALALGVPLVATIKQFADTGSALNDMAGRTGASVEALSKLKFAAEQTGTDIEGLEGSLRKLTQHIGDALAGDKAAAETFNRLGLNARKLSKLDADEKLAVIADRLAALPNEATRTAATLDLFGKSGAALLPMLNDGSRGLLELTHRAEKLGLVMSIEDAQAADELGDRIDEIGAVAKRTAVVLGSALAPAAMQVADHVLDAATAAAEFAKENPSVIQTVALATAGAGAAGVAMIGLGTGLKVAAGGFGLLGTAAKAALSPIGLTTLAAGGIGYVIATQTEIGREAFQSLSTTAVTVAGDIKTTWGGITDAVGADDLALAGQVAMAGLNVVMQTGLREVRDVWNVGTSALQTQWADTFAGMQIVAAHLGAAVKTVFVNMIAVADNTMAAIQRIGLATVEKLTTVRFDVGIALGINTEGEKASALGRIQTERDAMERGLKKRGEERDRERQQIGGDLGASLKGIKDNWQKERADIEAAQTEGIIASEKKLTYAREQLARVRAKAAKAKEEADAKKDDPNKKPPGSPRDLKTGKTTAGGKHSEGTVSGIVASLTRDAFVAMGPDAEMIRFGDATDQTTQKIREQTKALEDRNRAAAGADANQPKAPARANAQPAMTREQQAAALQQWNQQRKEAVAAKKKADEQKRIAAINERRAKKGLKPLGPDGKVAPEVPTIDLPEPDSEGVRHVDQPLPDVPRSEATVADLAPSDEAVLKSFRDEGMTEEQLGDVTAKAFEERRAKLEAEKKIASVFKPVNESPRPVGEGAQRAGEGTGQQQAPNLEADAIAWAEAHKLPLPNTTDDMDKLLAQYQQSATFKKTQPKPEARSSKPAVPGPQPGQPIDQQAIAWAEQQGLPLPNTGEEADKLVEQFKKSATAKKLQPTLAAPLPPTGLSPRAQEAMTKAGIPLPAQPNANSASPLQTASNTAADALARFAAKMASVEVNLPELNAQFSDLRVPEITPEPPPMERVVVESVGQRDDQILGDIRDELRRLRADVKASNTYSA